MDVPRIDRLLALSEFIADTWHPLTNLQYLRVRPGVPYLRPGFSVLGLVCLAHHRLTRTGVWVITNPGARETADYQAEGEHSDIFLPTAVVEYFGFRDGIGSFHVGELPADIKRLMHRARRTDTSSLLEIGLVYRKRPREIAGAVVRAMPPSLLQE